MPNKFHLTPTPGALQIGRTWEPDPEGRLRPPAGGGGTRAGLAGPSTAGRVSLKWSARSRQRMRFEFSALPWEKLGRRPVMITLTYPGEWEVWVPDSRVFTRNREARTPGPGAVGRVVTGVGRCERSAEGRRNRQSRRRARALQSG